MTKEKGREGDGIGDRAISNFTLVETKRNETKAIRYLRRAFRGSDFAESLLSYRRKRLSVVVRSGGGREEGREGVRFCKTRDTMPSNI